MKKFLSRHGGSVTGTLCGFDRVVFRGTLRMLAHVGGLRTYLWASRVLLKDFGDHARELQRRLKAASEALAGREARPWLYLSSSSISKEEIAREIAERDGIDHGLVCILRAVEPCLSYEIVRDREARRLDVKARHRKCLHIYHYRIDRQFGFMHARIQTWFPFSIQVCLNGREWLARSMDEAGLAYAQRDNCFVWLEDHKRAQQLMDQQVQANWPQLLDRIAGEVNPQHQEMFRDFPMKYYWSTYQSEWASDLLFADRARLARFYPKLVQHGLTTFLSPDVMRFLGRKIPASGHLPGRLKANVVSDIKRRPEGVRIKHRVATNSIKMYDKQGSVLRVETTINDTRQFKVFRRPEGKPDAPQSWQRMRKGIADLHRLTRICQAANDRYLDALASVEDTKSLGELSAQLCQPTWRNGRRVRALNPYAPDDAQLLEIISRGEFIINGLRNRDLRRLLFDDDAAPKSVQRRHTAAVSRKLTILRAHKLIHKVPRTHRYHLTARGRTAVTALLTARRASSDLLTKLAA